MLLVAIVHVKGWSISIAVRPAHCTIAKSLTRATFRYFVSTATEICPSSFT